MSKRASHDLSRVLTVHIDRPLDQVAAYLADPRNMNDWAAGLGHTLEHGPEGWTAQGATGKVHIRFCEANAFGVADHWVEVAPDTEVYVPLRAIANGTGCDVQLTLLRAPDMDDAQMATDAAQIERDLEALRARLTRA